MWVIVQQSADGTVLNSFSGPDTDLLVDSRIGVMWERLRNNFTPAVFDSLIAQGQRFFLLNWPAQGDVLEILPAHAQPVPDVAPDALPWWVWLAGGYVLLRLLR